MNIIPVPIQTRRVVARYVNLIADTALDEDEQPDAVYPTGSVVFTRVAGPRVWVDTEQADGTTVKITKLPIEVPVDPDTGEIKLPHAPTSGVRLPVGQWKVQEVVGARSTTPWTLTLEPDDGDALVDLHTQAPITPDPTVVLVPSLETMERAEAAADRAEVAAAAAEGAVGEGIAGAVADWLAANPLDADPAGTAAAAVQAHEGAADPHPQYVTESDLPAPPDLSGYVTSDDARLSDARTPTAHGHAVTDVTGLAGILAGKSDTDHSHSWGTITSKPATFPPSGHTHSSADISDSTTTGRAVLTASTAAAARTAIGAGTSDLVIGTTASTAKAGNYAPTWTQVTSKPTTFPPAEHDHDGDYYTKAQSDAALAALPVLRQEVVTVPNAGWTDSVTLSVNGLTGVHWVSPVTAAGAATWAAGNWWASSPTDGQLMITGEIQPTADPVNIRVVWWGEKAL